MDISWLPHWTTGAALGAGLGCALYSCIKPPSANSPDFKDKWVEGLPLLIGSIFLVLPMWVGGAILLAFGWRHSPWGWNVAGLILFLWIPKRTSDQWLGESKGRKSTNKAPGDAAPPSAKSDQTLR